VQFPFGIIQLAIRISRQKIFGNKIKEGRKTDEINNFTVILSEK
jgi:hypothetical protein